MSPEMIASLAGAVQDKDEWAVVLKGIRSEDGFEVTVTGWRLPEQERTSGHVDLGKDVLEDDDVCVVHSHHSSFKASFSQLDIDKLNTRYPASIVIAQSRTAFLGFDYQGTGKVILPCGAKGEVPFGIQCTVGPEISRVNRVVHDEHDLGDCFKYSNTAEEPYQVLWQSACGLQERGKPRPMPMAFGATTEILQHVEKLPREHHRVQKWENKGGFGYQSPKYDYPKREIIPGYICTKCRGELAWSLAQKGDGYCHQCNLYFTIPETREQIEAKGKGKASDQKDVNGDRDWANTEWCDECYEWVDWAGGTCPDCQAPMCTDCRQYHDGDCQPLRSQLGLVQGVY